MSKRGLFLFKLGRRAVILFWMIVIITLIALYFLMPSLYYHFNYQKTPFVNTPTG
jgi:hypothetical protein